jgi:hypothetical protein
LIDKAHQLKLECDSLSQGIKDRLINEFKEPEAIRSMILLVKEQIMQLQMTVPNLPFGELKRTKEMDLLNLRMNLRQLEKMEQEGSVMFFMEMQLEINRINAQLSCIDAFILCLARKKAELRSQSEQAA